MIIFTRTFDFLDWLIPRTMDFPRNQRFVVTQRLRDAALDFQERIIEANHLRGRVRLERLRQADAELDKVRLYLRMAVRWKWLNEGHVGAILWDCPVRGPVAETAGCCVAGRSTTIVTTHAVPTATGTTRTTVTGTTGFG